MLVLCLLGLFTLQIISAERVEGKLNVHIVSHTHDDVNWLKTTDQYYYGANNSIQHAAVQHVLDSVIHSLSLSSKRKFIYVEQAFFQRWWNQQTEETHNLVKNLVSNGQLEFVNGGWCMHDEATTHYIGMIDQTTLGHAYIKKIFGEEHVPTAGWQIDPFGHSATQATYMSAGFGFDGLVVGRIDFRDRSKRTETKTLEFVWEPSQSFGEGAQVFTSCDINGNYFPPSGLCFDLQCSDPPVQDDPHLEDVNIRERVETFITDALSYANATVGDVMFKMGSDFQYEYAEEDFKNLDKLIRYVNLDGRVHAFYSTPSQYFAAKREETWTVKTDDFFPYADGDHMYWTGYFTSRPTLKRLERYTSGTLQAARHLVFFSNGDAESYLRLEKASGLAQHHDSVSGTSKQHVTYDLAKRLSKGLDRARTGMTSAWSTILGGNVELDLCPLINVSICEASQVDTLSFATVVYNPIARERAITVRIPVQDFRIQVLDKDGNNISSSVVPTAYTTGLQAGSAPYTLYFEADVGPLGWETYFIQPSSSEVQWMPRSSKDVLERKAFALENEHISAHFSSQDGRLLSITNKDLGDRISVRPEFGYYQSYDRDGQKSGAYIFRPLEETSSNIVMSPTYRVYKTDNVVEVHRNLTSWIQQILRIKKSAQYLEHEWNVGPIPVGDGIGKEVIVNYMTDVESGDTFYTDSNGREMLERVRNYRATYNLTDTDIAGNYYPINSGAYLKDDLRQFSVAVDRAQGAASIRPGSLEFMLHRRTLLDDSRGVGEPLNETESITPYPDAKRVGFGLNATGIHRITFGASSVSAPVNGNELLRSTAVETFNDAQLFFQPIAVGAYDGWIHSNLALSGSLLVASLPGNVNLDTLALHPTEAGAALLRLSHMYGVGESSTQSQEVSVDVTTLFPSSFTVASVTQESLSAIPLRATQKWNTDTPNPTDVSIFGSLEGTTITLQPMQIATLRVNFA